MNHAQPKLPGSASRLIAMAISLVGHADRVRSQMECSAEDFQAYCAGTKEPPWPELDRLIHLLTREQGKVIADYQRLLAKVREPRES
jgi:hypothetical protein